MTIVALSGCTIKNTPNPTITATPTVMPTPVPTILPTTTLTTPSVTPMSPPRSLNTGTYIVNKLPMGEGQLSVDNNMSRDAVILMANDSDPKHAVLAVYVKAKSQYTVLGIPDGRYVLYDMVGTDWDGNAKKFVVTNEYARFGEALEYITTDIHSRSYDISLQPVPTTNANVEYLMPDQMPSI